MPPVPLVAVTITSADAGLLVAIVVLLVLALVLAAAETALTRVTRPRADALAEEQRRGGEALVELVAHPEQYVTTVVFLLLGCQLVQATLVGILADRLFGIVGMVVAIAIDVGVVFVLAETAPKTWAVLNAERVSLAVARPVRAVARFAPVRLATGGLIAVSNLAVPGSGLKQGPFVSSEEELLAVAELGVEEGVIEEDDRALIESIIEFGDTIVREVMIPRPDMVTVPAHFRVGDVMEIFLLNGYSRLPVCGEEGLDDVVGLAYAKDLMGAERDGMQDAPVGDLVRPARFVPETKRVPDMLREMQRDKFHMAIAVDEYGVTAGLVTLEDIIEELVGEIVDEFDVDDPIVEPLPGGGIRVHGRTPLDQVNDLLRARLPEGDWDTIGGLVYDQLGHVPVEGETVRVAGWHLTAQRIQGRRIGRVSITPDHTPGRPPDAATDSDTDAGTRPGRPAADGPGGPTPEPDEPGDPTPGAKAPGGDPPTAGPPGRRPGTNGTSGARLPPAPHATGTDIAARRDVRARARSGGDHGQVGGAEALPFGLLVFVVGALLVASAWAVIDAKLAVDAAARQATRHFVEADVDEPAGAADAEEAAVAAGLAALDAHGRDPARATVGLSALDATDGQAGFTRCARVTFTATYEVPALTIPWIGGFGDGIGVTSSHSELVDPFRSGVPGSAQSCDG